MKDKVNTIYAPAWKLREQAHIEKTLGTGIICTTCGATLATYHDWCSAPLDVACPGFQAIENAISTAPRDCKP